MQDKARHPSSALRPSQASAAELVAGGSQIAIPAKQPLGGLTQDPVAEYALSASPAQIDAEEIRLMEWVAQKHRIFPPDEIAELAAQGWRLAGSLHNHLVFQHVPSGVRMHDVHASNFIRRKNGSLIPIDVFFEGLPLCPG